MHLSGGDDELTVFDGDLDALSGSEAGVLDPSTGELHPGGKPAGPSLADFMLDGALDKLVQTDAMSRSSFDCSRVERRADSGIEAARETTNRIDTVLGADLKEGCKGSSAFGLERGDIVGIKVCATVQVKELATQHVGFGIVCDECAMIFDDQDVIHGLTPLASSHLRILATAPLSIVGRGCGR